MPDLWLVKPCSCASCVPVGAAHHRLDFHVAHSHHGAYHSFSLMQRSCKGFKCLDKYSVCFVWAISHDDANIQKLQSPSYLATTLDIIIMPWMETSSMISKKKKTIRMSTKQAYLAGHTVHFSTGSSSNVTMWQKIRSTRRRQWVIQLSE